MSKSASVVASAMVMMSVFADGPDAAEHEVCDLGEELACGTKAWNVGRDEFVRRHPRCWFMKDGADRLVLREDCVRFFGMPVCEDSLCFGSNGLDRVEISLFTKGSSAEEVKGGRTAEIVKRVSERVRTDRIEVSTLDCGRGRTIVTFRWRYLFPRLEASVGESVLEGTSRGEYMTFRLSRSDPKPVVPECPERRVRRRGLGDVYLDGVPMVNQGRLGYCAPATVARILRYYGIDIGMHELALMLDTEYGGGTMVGGDFPALTEIAGLFGLRRTDYKNFTIYDEEFFARYNVVAHANGGRVLEIGDYTSVETIDGERVRVRDYAKMAGDVDKAMMRKARAADTDGFRRFQAGIIESVDRGWPLFWSVDRLFAWDVEGAVRDSGHARLVVGYNRLTDEVLYSDSWGGDDELKRAPMSEAWCVTDFLSCLSPK